MDSTSCRYYSTSKESLLLCIVCIVFNKTMSLVGPRKVFKIVITFVSESWRSHWWKTAEMSAWSSSLAHSVLSFYSLLCKVLPSSVWAASATQQEYDTFTFAIRLLTCLGSVRALQLIVTFYHVSYITHGRRSRNTCIAHFRKLICHVM